MRKFEAEPFTKEEDDALAAKFDAWTQELTDRERRILGIAIAVSGARSVDASAMATTPLAGPQIAAILAAVAALVVTGGQTLSPDSTESKDREAGGEGTPCDPSTRS